MDASPEAALPPKFGEVPGRAGLRENPWGALMEIDEGEKDPARFDDQSECNLRPLWGFPSIQTIYSFDQSNRKLWIDRMSGKGVS
jgi:hypothetical protein